MKRWDDILFNCSFRLLQLLLSFSIYGYKQINSEINETYIKTSLSVTPEDMDEIQRRLFDIQRIEKQNFKAKQNKKFKRDRSNQQGSVFEEDPILNLLEESKSKRPRKRRFKKQKHAVQDKLVVNLSSIELTTSAEKLLKQIKHELEKWESDDKIYIETNAARSILKCIKENGYVVVTASSGCGKSSLVRHVALQMHKDGFDVLPVTNPNDIITWYNPNKETLFVVIDYCGTYTLNPVKYEN
ncbi:unnamed protein product [Mytilus edulis]|uniref:Novel STAND NTPase 3 domain-containing protein n=1 Tax=Mytilus edulis TaxID=6550 RepID=A0A8S3T9U8_MYTED|nr:unnamed protein product [Mytilus edulis]